MLTRRDAPVRRHAVRPAALGANGLSRRTILRAAGLGAVTVPVLGALGSVQRAEAAPAAAAGKIERKKTVCPFCAVGCSIWAEVENGVWIGQEPVFESPVNMGTH